MLGGGLEQMFGQARRLPLKRCARPRRAVRDPAPCATRAPHRRSRTSARFLRLRSGDRLPSTATRCSRVRASNDPSLEITTAPFVSQVSLRSITARATGVAQARSSCEPSAAMPTRARPASPSDAASPQSLPIRSARSSLPPPPDRAIPTPRRQQIASAKIRRITRCTDRGQPDMPTAARADHRSAIGTERNRLGRILGLPQDVEALLLVDRTDEHAARHVIVLGRHLQLVARRTIEAETCKGLASPQAHRTNWPSPPPSPTDEPRHRPRPSDRSTTSPLNGTLLAFT